MNGSIIRQNRVTIDGTSHNENISFSVSNLVKNNNQFIEITFVANKDYIYKTRDKKNILYPPSSIPIELIGNNLLILMSCLISSISLAFKNENLSDFGNTVNDGKYLMIMNKFPDTKNKLVIDIFDMETEEQIISFLLSRTKITLLIFLIQSSFSNIKQSQKFLVSYKKYFFKMTKNIKNEFIINKTVFRNSEIEILRNIAYLLTFDFRYEIKLNNYKKIYRQVLIFEDKDKDYVVVIKKINDENNFYFKINSQILAALILLLQNNTFKANNELVAKNKIFNSKYITKIGKNLVGFDIDDKSYKNNIDSIIIKVSDLDNKYYIEINLCNEWIFIFSELIDLYNKIPVIKFYSHQWCINNYVIRITHFQNENILLMFKHKNSDDVVNVILDPTSHFELIHKIIELVQEIKNFKFTILNLENPKENLSVVKIIKKNGTIISTQNGVEFGKPYLTESDKYQIKYSSINKMLFGRWLSVHTERINITSMGVITTIDSEYILDQDERNKSSFVSLILLSSLSFKGVD